jgi:hypothetical protein
MISACIAAKWILSTSRQRRGATAEYKHDQIDYVIDVDESARINVSAACIRDRSRATREYVHDQIDDIVNVNYLSRAIDVAGSA